MGSSEKVSPYRAARVVEDPRGLAQRTGGPDDVRDIEADSLRAMFDDTHAAATAARSPRSVGCGRCAPTRRFNPRRRPPEHYLRIAADAFERTSRRAIDLIVSGELG